MNDAHIAPSGRYWHYAVESHISGPHVVALTNSPSVAQAVLESHCLIEDEHGQYLNGRVWRYEAQDAGKEPALGFPFPRELGEWGQFYDGDWIWSPAYRDACHG